MILVVLQVINLVVVAVTAGLCGYWFCHRRIIRYRSCAGNDLHLVQTSRAASRNSQLLADLRVVQHLASDIAKNVGEHDNEVRAINAQLAHMGGETPVDPESVRMAVAKLQEMNEDLLARNGTLRQELELANQQLQDQAEELKSRSVEAHTDSLTGLANRRALDNQLRQSIGEFEEHERTFSLTLIDIDNFKTFNDQYGHRAGDAVLRFVAARISELADVTDMVSRYGGEEFAIVHQDSTLRYAVDFARRVRRMVEHSTLEIGGGQQVGITISAGVATIQPSESASFLLERADQALYSSKEWGRNRISYHDGSQILAADCTAPDSTSERDADARLNVQWHKRPDFLFPCEQFVEVVNKRLAESRRGGTTPGMLLVEIDRSEELMPKLTPNALSRILDATALHLKATCRETDSLTYFGQVRFAVLLPDTSTNALMRMAERIRQEVAESQLTIAEESLRFTVSIGASRATADDDVRKILHRTEHGLTSAQNDGGNCVIYNAAFEETADPNAPATEVTAAMIEEKPSH